MKSNLAQYKVNGKFIAKAYPLEPYWQTQKGQEYLKEYYILEEAYRCGLINWDERSVYQCQLAHFGMPCPWSECYHEVEKPKSEKQLHSLAKEWAQHNV